MIGLALILAAGGTDWQPQALDTFRAPASMFFCNGNEAEAGLFTVFLRHNPDVSVIEVSRTASAGASVVIKDRLHDVSRRELGGDRVELKIPLAEGAQRAEFVLILGDGPAKGSVAWTTGDETYSGTCVGAPVPPERTK